MPAKKKTPAEIRKAGRKLSQKIKKGSRNSASATRKANRKTKRTKRAEKRTNRISASITRQKNKKDDPRNSGSVNQAAKASRIKRLESRLKRNAPTAKNKVPPSR